MVKPQNVVIFAVDPDDSSPEAFLRRLAGLVKYALDKNAGQARLAQLAAATAQREAAVRLGLQWMEQRGLVEVTISDGTAYFGAGKFHDPAQAGQTLARLKTLITEINAYRKYFKTAEKEHLL